MSNENKYVNATKQRLSTIRLRTWTLTLAIVIALVFYFLVSITTKEAISWIDFVLLCAVQIVCHSIYFPDGDLYGQKNQDYINNKETYNTKAEAINQSKGIAKLREYCKIEFEERKLRYILNECGIIGITLEELEILKQKSPKEIKKLKSFETTEMVDGEPKTKIITFSKFKKKKLYALIFNKIPVEENHPETILSAVESNGNKAIKDGSTTYKMHSYIRKIMQAVLLGGIFAYIGYTLRDGIGIGEIVSIIMYLTTLFTTAVISFSSGETCSKVHKSRFYLELSNFIDGFNEWDEKTQAKIELPIIHKQTVPQVTIVPLADINIEDLAPIDEINNEEKSE